MRLGFKNSQNIKIFIMSCVKVFCFALVVVGSCFSVVKGGTQVTKVTCDLGSDVIFKNPCPEKFNECSFKKGGDRRFIVNRGVFEESHKYKLDDDKTQVIMKDCNPYDDASYAWICLSCHVIEHFYLEFPQE